MTTTKHTSQAADLRAGMTLDELGAFLTEIHQSGANGDEPVRAVVNVRGRIKTLTVEVRR